MSRVESSPIFFLDKAECEELKNEKHKAIITPYELIKNNRQYFYKYKHENLETISSVKLILQPRHTKMSSPQEQRQHFLMFVITIITKLGFARLFLAAAIFHHSEQIDVVMEFCERVDDRDVIWCYFDFIGGLLICGTILLFISILTEAFGVDKNGYITILHLIGCICLMAASVIYVLLGHKDLLDFFVIDQPNVIGNLWIAGGFITAFCQAFLISKSKGIFPVCLHWIRPIHDLWNHIE